MRVFTIQASSQVHGIDRMLKHISVVVSISTAGEHVTPLFVCSQTNPTVKRLLRTQGFRLGLGLILRHRSKSRINSELFNEYG
jgi:N-acyl-D-aspartate/D-glutamate deacylase